MEIDITKQEAWKLIDAIKAYMKDYTVTGPVHKTFDNITKKTKGGCKRIITGGESPVVLVSCLLSRICVERDDIVY